MLGWEGSSSFADTPATLPAAATSLVFHIYDVSSFLWGILFMLRVANKLTFLMFYPFITICLTYLDSKVFFHVANRILQLQLPEHTGTVI